MNGRIRFPKARRVLAAAFLALALASAAFVVSSFLFIGWTDEGADVYAGGTILRDAAGDVMRVCLGPGDVDCRPSYEADADDWIAKALVAAEDGSFWSHRGVRPASVLRAAFQNLFRRRRVSGASTITMQTVRLIRPHPKTLWWKWREAVAAVKMERVRPKTWILSQYLNRAPFGSNFVGVEAAARGWFGKGAKDLGIGEAALLAGMVQAPSRFRPDRSYDRAVRRRDYVLARMEACGYITAEQRRAARGVRPEIRRSPRPFKHPHYCDYVLAALGLDRAARQRGGDVETALDPDVQRIVRASVDAAAAEGGWPVASVVVKVATGEVVALHCSGDYFGGGDGQVNTALAPRPAGSTLKPFLAALAMDRALATPETRLLDAPLAVKGYRPANFDGRYRGRVTLADSLVLSLNVPFVRLLARAGAETFADTLRRLGFRRLGRSGEEAGLGMAIGNVEVTLVELTQAYAALARGGDGVFSPEACYLVSDVLSGSERSGAALGHVADVAVPRFAWKTGTSSAYRDAWTVAWNPDYAIGVWCGHKRGGFGDTTLVGATAAAPVCWTVARLLYPRRNGPWFAAPANVRTVEICALTGEPASADCPDRAAGRVIDGVSARRPCAAHRRMPDGTVATVGACARDDALRVVSPEDGAAFRLVGGAIAERIVFRVAGNAAGRTLRWFVDGGARGETTGAEPFVMETREGRHRVVAVDAAGEAAAVEISVSRAAGAPVDFEEKEMKE